VKRNCERCAGVQVFDFLTRGSIKEGELWQRCFEGMSLRELATGDYLPGIGPKQATSGTPTLCPL
jgi:hypothetical protein